MRPLRLAILALAWLVVLPVMAHQGRLTGYADIRLQGANVRYALTLSELPAAVAAPASAARAGSDLDSLVQRLAVAIEVRADGRSCPAVGGQTEAPAAGQLSTRILLVYKCPHPPRELAVRDGSFDVFGPDLHTLATVNWTGGRDTFAFAAERREARFVVNDGAPAPATGSFFLLGVEHILGGLDHLLFLAALLVGTWSRGAVVKVVTAFTVAHSLTLALAVLGVLALPERLVEGAIALSLVFVALVNLLGRRGAGAGAWAGFVFGLMHGLGFSSVLGGMGLPAQGRAWLLLQFNLGVEAGQLLVVAVALTALAWLRTQPWQQQGQRAISCFVLASGLLMFAQRVFLD